VLDEAERGRIRQRGGEHVARGDLDVTNPYGLRRVEVEPVQELQDLDEVGAEAVLERDPAAVDPARDEDDLLVLDVTHSSGPIPSGKSKTSGSENGSVVYQPRPRSQTSGGFRHSSIVVQIENVGAKS
jgi:hypothetical protein